MCEDFGLSFVKCSYWRNFAGGQINSWFGDDSDNSLTTFCRLLLVRRCPVLFHHNEEIATMTQRQKIQLFEENKVRTAWDDQAVMTTKI